MLAYMFATIFSGLAIPLVGPYVDRYGTILSATHLSLPGRHLCINVSRPTSLDFIHWLILASDFWAGVDVSARAWLVGEWFEQRRGFAMGVIGIGGALSVATVPIANAWLIENTSWQDTWITHAWVLGLCFVIPPYLLVRNRPESEGLFPDCQFDAPQTLPEEETKYHITRDNWERREALRDTTFWKLVLCWASTSLVGTGIVIYQKTIFQSVGVPDNKPYYVLGCRPALPLARV